MMKTIGKLILILILIYSDIFSQITINEIMYAPTDAANEWFELYNTGNASLNIQNWKWKDATSAIRTITTQSMTIPANGYLIVCEDSVKLRNQFQNFPGNFIQTTWSALNNTGDNIILIDQSNVRADSVVFQSSWGGNTGGFSLERVDPSGQSNNSLNWGTSVDLNKATPNKQNSITPKPFDLYLKSFTVMPLYPSAGETLEMDFIIKNTGMNSTENFSLNIYSDFNFDSIAGNNELLHSISYPFLNQSDSIRYNYSIANIDTGYKQYIAKVMYAGDDDTLNNRLIKKIYVSGQSGSGGGFVINEIMYDPLSNQSEWIELYNGSGQTININGWKYKEASVSVTLSSTDLLINPGDYFILVHDSTIYLTYDYLKSPESNQIIKFSASMSLNNTGENISITDSLNNIVDAVYYNPDWNNPEFPDTKGISLERINSAFMSNEKSNWSSCVNIKGGTPGLSNSVFTNNMKSNSSVSIFPNPFSPDADGHEDFALIKYKLKTIFAQMRVKVFDIRGRLVRELANNQITGSEGTIIFNGFGEDNQKLRIGIYILLIEAVDDRGGTVDVIKEPIVIAGKL